MPDWSAFRPEVLAALIENGPGSGPMRQTAASFRQLAQTFETLASEVDSRLAQLLSTWSSEAADRASQAFRQYSTGLRDMATVADTVSQQAEAQAEANDSARSAMPKLAEILRVLAAHAAALASQNYGLAAALMALYMTLSARASSTMSSFEAASLPNMEHTPAQQAPAITDPSANASDSVSQLLDKFTGESEQSFTPPEAMDLPQSSSSTLAGLKGGGFGGFDGIPGGIGLISGGVAALSSIPTGFRMPLEGQAAPRAFGMPGGVPATAPMAGGGAPGMFGSGGRTRRDREKERAVLDGTVVAPDLSDEVPPIGVVDVGEPDEVATPGQHTA